MVGAPTDDDGGSKTGSAYVYNNDGDYDQVAKLTAFDAVSEDRFGRSVAVYDDTVR